MPGAVTQAFTWLGHATVLLEIDGHRMLTDPVLRGHVGPLRRIGARPDPSSWADLDAVLISHVHHDHLDLPSLRRVAPDVPVVVPAGGAAVLAGTGREVIELAAGSSTTVGGVDVTATPAVHDADRLGSRVRAAPVGYLLGGTWFAGDTGPSPRHVDLAGEVGLALLPVGGWGLTLGPGHLDPRQAAEVAGTVGARRAAPIHWGTLFAPGAWHLRPSRSRDPGRLFAAAAAQLAPATDVVVARPGERIVTP